MIEIDWSSFIYQKSQEETSKPRGRDVKLVNNQEFSGIKERSN